MPNGIPAIGYKKVLENTFKSWSTNSFNYKIDVLNPFFSLPYSIAAFKAISLIGQLIHEKRVINLWFEICIIFSANWIRSEDTEWFIMLENDDDTWQTQLIKRSEHDQVNVNWWYLIFIDDALTYS